ncbi:MAG: BamA/TamA family outer membrane protein [Bacteroidales bacterium]|nr:BamA/TamA family outer membrane protein [Bacteroidales bacterium]
MKKHLLLLFIFLLSFNCLVAQEIDTVKAAGVIKPEEPKLVAPPDGDKDIAKNDIIKTGLSFGPLPIVAYDQDRGFEYGALLNIYNFGDGSWYPTPRSTWYFEVSAYTKGTQQYIITYDNRVLIPGVRISAAAQLVNEKALDFYGFNGYESVYHSDYDTYYYRLKRMVPSVKLDFTGNITKHLYWKAGYHFNYFKIGDYEDSDGKTPNTLFSLYKNAGIIPAGEAKGGISSALRVGLMYDSRNFEAAPTKGIWAEAHVAFAPKFLGTSVGYTKFNITFRHYVPIYRDRLVFAFRLNYQGYIGAAPAFYILPFDTILGPGYDRDGFGGYRTVRGLMRDRVQGINTGYFNTELRWKFVDFHVWKQNVTLALSGFFDGSRVFKGIDMESKIKLLNMGLDNFNFDYTSDNLNDRFHLAAGGGLRIIINQNFIVAVEYGKAFDKQDNAKGALYINTGYLF